MRLLTHPPQKRLSTRQISAAAQNIAAAQFAMYGFDVLEHGAQAGYLYGLAVANASGMLKVRVHGSFRGFWNLVDPFLDRTASRTAAECHKAIHRWFDRQDRLSAFCLVQFESADLTTMPRLYLATASDIAARQHMSVEMVGDTALYEQFEVEDGSGRHVVEVLPAQWRFSPERIAALMDAPAGKETAAFRLSEAACAAPAAAYVESLPMMN